jgi:hypothetical protein
MLLLLLGILGLKFLPTEAVVSSLEDNENNDDKEEAYIWNLTLSDPSSSIVFPWVVECIGVVCFFLLKRFEIPLPYAAVMFVCGIAMGFGAVYTVSKAEEEETWHQIDKLTVSIAQWSNIDSAVLLLVFLPGLIFRDAIEVGLNK